MDLDLLKFIKSDLRWGAVKKRHRSTIGRPRKQVRARRIKGNKIQDSVVSDYEKCGVAVLGQRFADEVPDVPIKKRIRKLQSPSVSTEVGRLPQPQTPTHKDVKHVLGELNKKDVSDSNIFSGIELLADVACHDGSVYDGFSQLEPMEIEKNTTPITDSHNTDVSKEEITPMASDVQNICDNNENGETEKSHVPKKALRLHWDLNTVMEEWEEPPCTPVDEKSNLNNIYNDDLLNSKTNLEGHEKSIISQVTEDEKVIITSKTSDDESCMSKSDVLDSFAYPPKSETVSTSTASVSLEQTTLKVEPLIKSDEVPEVSELVQGGGCLSFKGGDCDESKLTTSEDRLSDCCGSNVSHDERAEENNTVDKVKAGGYDSPVEDGELREPTIYHIWQKDEVEEDTECVDYESDYMYEDNNFDTNNKSVQAEIHVETNGKLGPETINEHHEGDKAYVLGSKVKDSDLEKKDNSLAEINNVRRNGGNLFGTDRSTSTSFGVRKDSNSVLRTRSDNIGYSYSRGERDSGSGKFTGWDRPYYRGRGVNDDGRGLNSHGYSRPKNIISRDNNQAINYNPREINGNFNNRPSPSGRNESYGGVISRGTSPPARGISRDRYRGVLRRVPQEGYNDSEPCYSERKVHSFSNNYNRGGAHIPQSRKRSRSRSRSGSPPIAWHFQKKGNNNMDTTNGGENNPDHHRPDTRFPFRKPGLSGEIEASRGGCNDRNVLNGQYRDNKRSSPVRNIRPVQRFDSPGYVGRLKSDDNNIRPVPRPGRFPQANINDRTIHDDNKYGMMNERNSFKARYPPHNNNNKDNNGFRYPPRNNEYNRCFKDSEKTIEEKGCRYTANKIANKIFNNTGERYFHKDKLQRE